MKRSIRIRIPFKQKYFNLDSRLLYVVAFFVIVAGVWVFTSPMKAQTIPNDAKPLCTDLAGGGPAPGIATWFESGTVTLNGAVKPADSLTFVEGLTVNGQLRRSNCNFYRWSEQMFLWLTSPAPARYGGNGRIFDSPVFFDVSPPDQNNGERTFIKHEVGKSRFFSLRTAQKGSHGLPVIFDRKGRMFEVEKPRFSPSGKQLILNKSAKSIEIDRVTLAKNGNPIFFDMAGKVIPKAKLLIRPDLKKSLIVQKFKIGSRTTFLDNLGNVVDVEPGQASFEDPPVLMAQNGSLIYYTTMVNDVYAYFLTREKNLGHDSLHSSFPTTQPELTDIVSFASAHHKTFPDPNALAIEVKASWIEATGLPDLDKYITMTATIPTYNQSNPNHLTPSGTKTVKMAMVGIHVVGSTAGHPEMIWATFEHDNNTPNTTFEYINTQNPLPVPKTSDTNGPWLFCTPGVNGIDFAHFNIPHMVFHSPDIDSLLRPRLPPLPPLPPFTPLPPLPPLPFTVSASDTIRMKAWGGGFDNRPNPLISSTAESNTEVISINNSVRGQLIPPDVRANYFMVGSTWTAGGSEPNGSFSHINPQTGQLVGNEVGTSQLANTTMETYQQGPSNLRNEGTNCFRCHATNHAFVSHMYDPLKPLFP
jgi:hypothetical protein